MWLVDRGKIENCSFWLPVALPEDAAFPGSKVLQPLGESVVAGSEARLLCMSSMATLMRTEATDLTPFRCLSVQTALKENRERFKSLACPLGGWSLEWRIKNNRKCLGIIQGEKSGGLSWTANRLMRFKSFSRNVPHCHRPRKLETLGVSLEGPAGQREKERVFHMTVCLQ